MILIDQLKNYKIYLASKSPWRHELLKGMGIAFEYLPLDVEEIYPANLEPVEVVKYLSALKLSPIDFAQYPKNSLFLACDTIVVLDGAIIGKPKDLADAKQILRKLSGKEHVVFTGVTLASESKQITGSKQTTVKFKALSDEEIDFYVNEYKPLDKAGAYGIQEWIGYVAIEYVSGSFYNIMGLPTKLLWDMFEEMVKSEILNLESEIVLTTPKQS